MAGSQRRRSYRPLEEFLILDITIGVHIKLLFASQLYTLISIEFSLTKRITSTSIKYISVQWTTATTKTMVRLNDANLGSISISSAYGHSVHLFVMQIFNE